MAYREIAPGIQVSKAAWDKKAQTLLTPEYLKILATLHRNLDRRRIQLLAVRQRKSEHYDQGALPCHLSPDPKITKGDWKVAPIPEDLKNRRVEITGPVNDTKMVINMLSRFGQSGARADMAMLDFEDSMRPTWKNVMDGVFNVIGASRGELSYVKKGKDGHSDKVYRLDPNDMAGVMVRVRGLHLNESNILIDGSKVSGALLDLSLCYFHTAQNFIDRGKTPKYYIPKIEYALEGAWWNDLFVQVQELSGHPRGTLRATFLIETLPAAFEMEQILYQIREHASGMNVGRWDKIFSDIKTLKMHKKLLSPDRAEIDMSKYWMDNYAKKLVKICHRRGAYAIGGMAAFTPGKDPDERKAQTEKVLRDKKNEFKIGHDGCWVSHPYFISPALECFPKSNQLEKILDDFEEHPELIMDGKGVRTRKGLQTNIRVGIAYLRGWNKGLGCIALDNLMEDLATLEISRTQVWQWLHYGIELQSGEIVNRTLIAEVFEQELQKILHELIQQNLPEKVTLRFAKEYECASKEAFELFTQAELTPFLESDSPLEIHPALETRQHMTEMSATL